jgi:hypothetical protein
LGVTGKYDFQGIQKAGRAGINALLASTAWGAWIIASPFHTVLDLVEDLAINFLANRGLLVVNIGAIYVSGEFQQSDFDKAFDDAIQKSKTPGLSDAQKKVIDDQVIASFRRFGRVGIPNS